MPYELCDLTVDRVDIVDEGANSAAFITLYKRKEQTHTMDVKEIIEKMNPEHAKVMQDELDRLNGEVTKANESAKTANDSCKTKQEELDKLKDSGTAAFDETETMKSMPESVKTAYLKMKQQKDAAEEAIRKAKLAEDDAKAVAKATELKALPIAQDKLIGVLKGCSTEVIEVLTTIAAAVDGVVLGEVGKNKGGSAGASSTGNDAWDQIEAKAADIIKAKGISKAKAISQAVDENPDLYKKYLEGGAN